jgi:2-polyprenyl-3-methyl-5-hydroxy-6-metoxy-1,4-benzoquinol methylase/Zn ribbon nucleic-acid-binding protein
VRDGPISGERPQVVASELVAADRCPVCDGQEFRQAFEEPPYRVMRCVECGTAVVTPRVVDPTSVYDAGYWRSRAARESGYHDHRAAEPLYLKTFRRRLEFVLRRRPRSGKALDVGCAAGFCMAAVRDLGFEPYGVEVSGTIASHAREHFGFDTVHVGTIEDAPFAHETFDLITMWDVVEHVVDPRSLLSRARLLLKPDGLLVVETQNIDSPFARALGRRWHHYKHAEHIYHFTPSSLRRLLEGTGFTVDSLTARYGGKYVSLEFIAERATRVHPLLSAALRPLARLDSLSLYVNVMDELIARARPRP